jgi:hypothetical protein
MSWDRIRFGRPLREFRIGKDEDCYLLGTFNDAARVAYGISHTGGSALCGVDLTTESDVSVVVVVVMMMMMIMMMMAGKLLKRALQRARWLQQTNWIISTVWWLQLCSSAAAKAEALTASSAALRAESIMSPRNPAPSSPVGRSCQRNARSDPPRVNKAPPPLFPPSPYRCRLLLRLAARARALWSKMRQNGASGARLHSFSHDGRRSRQAERRAARYGQHSPPSSKPCRKNAQHFPRARSTASTLRPALVEMTRAISARQ